MLYVVGDVQMLHLVLLPVQCQDITDFGFGVEILPEGEAMKSLNDIRCD
jgi:hypothetical protein